MRIELLYFDGCPSYQTLLPRLQALLEREGITDAVELRQVESFDAAEAERFLGSPTVRIEGEDIDLDAATRSPMTSSWSSRSTPSNRSRSLFPPPTSQSVGHGSRTGSGVATVRPTIDTVRS